MPGGGYDPNCDACGPDLPAGTSMGRLKSHPPPTGFSYQSLLSTLQANGIGWLAWSWGPDACKERRISADGDFSRLTRYGDDIVNNPIYGLKATSVRVPASPLDV
jgi:mannan endo-1,4-beta-mannosidase